MARKRKQSGSWYNGWGRGSKRTAALWTGTGTAWRLGAGEAAAVIGTAATLSTGYDLVKTEGGSYKKSIRGKPKTLALGWYVDFMSGIQHQMPKSFDPVIKTAGRHTDFEQTGFVADTILNRINQVILQRSLDLPIINAILGPLGNNQDAIITTNRGKVTWTNMSNVKICYEYYLVTPRRNASAANDFQQEYTFLSNILDTTSGGHDVITTWSPEAVPELMKNWKVLSKSVFRLSPGETGEIHWKNNVYKRFSEADRRDRTYEAGTATQLYVRWYGCPTAQQLIAAPNTIGPTDAAFGDNVLHTSWIMEQSVNYYRTDIFNPDANAWITNVQGLDPAKQIVTHEEADDDIVIAE